MKKNIKIGDTAFAQTLVVKKMKLRATADNLSREERDILRARFTLMDAAERGAATASVGEDLFNAAEAATADIGDG